MFTYGAWISHYYFRKQHFPFIPDIVNTSKLFNNIPWYIFQIISEGNFIEISERSCFNNLRFVQWFHTFLNNIHQKWSLKPRCSTPEEWILLSLAFAKIKSVHDFDVGVTLVGSFMSCLNWNSWQRCLRSAARPFLRVSRLKSPIRLISLDELLTPYIYILKEILLGHKAPRSRTSCRKYTLSEVTANSSYLTSDELPLIRGRGSDA